MARRLMQEGWTLSAWNRSAEKAQPLEAAGAAVCHSAADVVSKSDIVLLMLADAAAIRSVLVWGSAQYLCTLLLFQIVNAVGGGRHTHLLVAVRV